MFENVYWVAGESERLSSMVYWYPKVQDLKIPMPKTEIIEVPTEVLQDLAYQERGWTLPKKYYKQILAAIKTLKNKYGVFIRSDLCSGKHEWVETCHITADEVKDEHRIKWHLVNVCAANAMADIMGLPLKAIVVREFIPLAWQFKAFSGMPVAPERRYYIQDGKVLCHHPYWVEDAVERGVQYRRAEAPDGWRELLTLMNHETVYEVKRLSKYAKMIGECLDGFWSVDFARGQNRRWYLIDMGDGWRSWHPENCPTWESMKRERIKSLWSGLC